MCSCGLSWSFRLRLSLLELFGTLHSAMPRVPRVLLAESHGHSACLHEILVHRGITSQAMRCALHTCSSILCFLRGAQRQRAGSAMTQQIVSLFRQSLPKSGN